MTHREYFYTIDTRGNVWHDGTAIDDAAFLDFFYRRLRTNTTNLHTEYEYYAPCGSEWNFVQCEDTPHVFSSMRDAKLYYAPSLSQDFDARALGFGVNGVLYHRSHLGTWGRITAALALELSRSISPWGPWYVYHNDALSINEVIPPIDLPDHVQVLRPRAGNACCACGLETDQGLKMSFVFDREKQSAESWFIADRRLMGSLNIMHGGYVSLLLDETMGKIMSGLGIKAPTAQLNVRYRSPVAIGVQLYMRATLMKAEGRKHHVAAELYDARDVTKPLAEAEALFIAMKTHNSEQIPHVNEESV